MEIRNCKKCGRIYNYLSGPNLCPRCVKETDDKFHEVKQYIYDNPGVGVVEVSEAMEVSVSQIKQWVREERLEFAEGSVTGLTCEKCGRSLRTGRFCQACKDSLAHKLGRVYEEPSKKTTVHEHDSAKMRFLK